MLNLNVKKDQNNRAQAYERLLALKNKKLTNSEIITNITQEFGLPYGTIHQWLKYNLSPFGKRKLQYRPELFYVLGSLLGDGCAYHWKKGDKYMVVIVGEKELIEKFSEKLFLCTGKRIKGYAYRDRNAWYLKTWNVELYRFLKKVKENPFSISTLLNNTPYQENMLQFIEGYFDAEGCVKIIREPARKTPKICLDICSTDYPTLEIIREAFNEILSIEARYSIQKPNSHWKSYNKKIAYHLRIYKKEFIRKFLENIKTIKLKPEKIIYVDNWLNNGQ